jgi:DNA-binding NtrC family response regulator
MLGQVRRSWYRKGPGIVPRAEVRSPRLRARSSSVAIFRDLATCRGARPHAGRFRSELFYRLNVFPIHLPPLRERPDDVALLTSFFAQKYRARFRKPITRIDEASLARLRAYPWPGNVRELEHVVERAVLLSEGEVLRVDVPFAGAEAAGAPPRAAAPPATLEEAEREHIRRALAHTGGRVSGRGGAADVLGVPDSTLRSRTKKLGIR